MFVKKLVEKASKKSGVVKKNGIKASELNARLVFHNGIPSASISLAYDSIQNILAISTKDGRIKLLGKDNTQALLVSNEPLPSKFMQFLDNHGVLFRVTVQNHIEVWDIETKTLAYVYMMNEDITAFTVIQQTSYVYVGNSVGNVIVLKLDQVTNHLQQMNYNIPLSASHGNTSEVADDTAVLHIMPLPKAESKRVLLIFRDGLIVLWGIEESKVLLVMGGNVLSLSNESKKVTSACWACPFGSKLIVGYNTGEIYLWNVPSLSADMEIPSAQNIPSYKLNLSYKMEKIPILSLKWVYGDGKCSRLYVNGFFNSSSSNMFQIVLLNEHTASRTIKLILPLLEPCLDMEIISSAFNQNKQNQNSLLLVLKSGRLCTFDDYAIEKYLLQNQSRSPPSLPKQVMLRLPFTDSTITVAKFITNDSNFMSGINEDYNMLMKSFPALLPTEGRAKDGNSLSFVRFNGFSNIKNLYITGHSDGTINFWDISCPLLIPISSVKQQSEDDHSLSGIPVTALYFDITSRNFVCGDQSGMVRIFKFKSEPFSTESNLFSLQGNVKKGSNQIIQSIKLIKVNGAVISIDVNNHSKHLAVGTDQGYVSVIETEGPTVLFQHHTTSEVCNSIMSVRFETCSFHGFEKKVLFIGMKDSSVLALESDTGNTLSTSTIHPKKPARALYMQILDGSDSPNSSGANFVEDASHKQSFLLLCNEKTVYVYSLHHAVQGIKRVVYKKKFHGTCCWASTFSNNSDVALALHFQGGKIEIRSLPELTLLKEISVRGLTIQNSKSDSYSDNALCSSSDGELILVNGDQEVFFVSLLLRKEIYRFLDPISDVYQGMIAVEEEPISGLTIHKEKKKGIFSSIMKDTKEKHTLETEVKNPAASTADELSNTFSIANFPLDNKISEQLVVDEEDEVELNIDDIDIEDEKPKGNNMMAAINKQKITSKFMAIKGKLKQKMIKNEKGSAKAEHEEEQADTVDQIKKKYGFASAVDPNAAKLAQNKLHENLRKLQGISLRATEMQGTAQSFSAMASEVLRTAEKDKQIS
ncbi:hypothetical protein AQUCO_01500343v1 [Aquilegia coerulea]|uniref:Lethal giant larvae (Lgl)-like C-terminal domain-containing protein n=1 Tax=Aquilegia coerulea TaxID=218851 RepID=A0A2G5DT95_AQUCA|nr:hypothetical protein AQUCO_01500343v1 [Aquilegia coerulea]